MSGVSSNRRTEGTVNVRRSAISRRHRKQQETPSDWEFLGLGPVPSVLGRTSLVATLAYVIVFLVSFALIGRHDCPYDYLSPLSGEMAEHHHSGNLMCWFFTASMFFGLVAMALLGCRSLVAGLVAAVLVAVATGGFYVAGYVREGFALFVLVGVVVCALALILLRRPLMALTIGVVSVFICMQLAFCLAQMGAFGEPPEISPAYAEIMGLDSEQETSEGAA